jgi:aryl-alcohol dehydrogenase-like predicted oxidoreductase
LQAVKKFALQGVIMKEEPKTSRRAFLKGSTFALAGLAAGERIAFAAEPRSESALPDLLATPKSTRRGDMLYRTLGKTGEEVSLIGLGGFHIGTQREESASICIIRAAIDGGITFMDNCWDYNEGQSEIRMGKVLQSGYRDKVFLMTKIDGRDKISAAHQIEQSLQRLQTDRIDLLQFHEIIRMEDPDRVFTEGGAWEAVQAAKQAGKIRYIGFTGHKDPIVHLRMLDSAQKNGVYFDAVQMPVNVMDFHFRSFQHRVLPRLVKESIGVLAMKTFGSPFILEHVLQSKTATAKELFHFSMSHPVSVVITGIDSLKILDQALEAARTFKPMTNVARLALAARVKAAALTGKYEKFKTTTHFDGTARNPHWLGKAA